MILKTIDQDNNIIYQLKCNCGYLGHEIYFNTWDKEDPDVLVTVQLTKLPFRTRFIRGIRYIFGNLGNNNGHYEDIITTKEELKSILKDLQ